jgi:hypothetical protein
VSYLAICPTRGRDYCRTLLPRRALNTDKSVWELAQYLHAGLGMPEEAASVLIARGSWWLRQTPSLPVRFTPDMGTQRQESWEDARERLMTASTLAKAAAFYQAAQDSGRLSALLEASLGRCMAGVRACRVLFPALSLAPPSTSLLVRLTHKRDSAAAFAASAAAAAGSSGSSGQQTTHLVSSAAEDEIVLPVWSNNSVLELEAALLEAEELLQTIDCDRPDDVAGGGGGDAVLPMCYLALKAYCEAVRYRFMHLELQQQLYTPHKQAQGVAYLRSAARVLSSIIVVVGGADGNGSGSASASEEYGGVVPVLPMRYAVCLIWKCK